MDVTLPTIYSRSAAELSSYRAQVVFVVAIIFTITSTVSIILRLAAKRISKAKLEVDDYVIIVAQVCRTSQPTCCSYLERDFELTL
jgi:hypothetical protein